LFTNKKKTDADAVYAQRKLMNALPTPIGYKILVKMYKVIEEKTKSGLYLPDQTKQDENTASLIAQVLEVGPDAYRDQTRFPSGPWCAKGDYVILRSYSGTRIKIDGEEYRLINDDTPEAVVPDPQKVERV
jgi:co-chaperonin GroES (HSP10)